MTRLVILTIACIASGIAHSEDATEIPLKRIWALEMPGTRDIRKLEKEHTTASHAQLTSEIRAALWDRPSQDDDSNAANAFVVAGTGYKALKSAHGVLVKGDDRIEQVAEGDALSVVFFSYQFGPYVHLSRVIREDNKITLHYHFTPHKAEVTSAHFAVVPLGKLEEGQYEIVIKQEPMEDKYKQAGFKPIDSKSANRVVCKSSSFFVTTTPSEQ